MLPSKFSFQFVSKRKMQSSAAAQNTAPNALLDNVQPEENVDSDKRNFLKIAGIAGAGLVASQLIPHKASALIMGGIPSAGVVGLKNSSGTEIDPATETTLGYIKTQTNKLSFDGSSNLYVQAASNFSSQLENSGGMIINPATEDTLTLIKGQTNRLNFDVSGNLLTSSSGGVASYVGVRDTTNTQINPATDDAIQYLRRIVKLMESQAVVDSGNRQRITLDSLGTSTTITNTVPVSGTVALGAGAAAIGTVTLGPGTNGVGQVTVSSIDGQTHQMFQDFAKSAYASGIRQNLIFS